MGLFYSKRPRTSAGNPAQHAGELPRPAVSWTDGERYARHRALTYTPPAVTGKRPSLIALSLHRLEKLVTRRSGVMPWKVRGIKAAIEKHPGATAQRVRLATQILHRHPDKITPAGHLRQRRDQALHSVEILLRFLLGRVNVQRSNQYLDFMEVQRTTLQHIAQQTGLSVSAVRDAHVLLLEAGFLRMERRRRPTPTGWQEEPPRRWLAPHLFAALGLGKQYLNQLQGRPSRTAPPTPYPALPESNPADSPPLTTTQRSTGRSQAAALLRIIRGEPPPS